MIESIRRIVKSLGLYRTLTTVEIILLSYRITALTCYTLPVPGVRIGRETFTVSQVRQLRKDLGETTAQFGARFARGRRIVEDWEQGRRTPDPFVAREMKRLAEKRKGKVA